MAALISEPTIRPPINFPIMIDQLFDLDDALTATFAEAPIQYDRDHHGDHEIITATDHDQEVETRNPNNDSIAAAPMADVDSCAVCMESFRSGAAEQRREPIPCGHVYHAGCIATWLSVRSSCPLCRRRVSGADQFSSAGKQ